MDDTAVGCLDVREHPGVRRRGAVVYGVFGVAVVVFLGLAFTGLYGVRTDTVRASGGGYELAVHHGRTSRPALATPFDVSVRRPGGFEEPVTVAVTATYFRLWDENGLFPEPADEVYEDGWLVWEFDPPEGEVLRITYDARIEPAAQSGRRGRVEVRDASGAAVVGVSFETEVLP